MRALVFLTAGFLCDSPVTKSSDSHPGGSLQIKNILDSNVCTLNGCRSLYQMIVIWALRPLSVVCRLGFWRFFVVTSAQLDCAATVADCEP